MRAVIQRVSFAKVEVSGEIVGEIGTGILALVGFQNTDNENEYQYMIDKITNLRIFEDPDGKMNLSVRDLGGSVLIVPNFTLYGDARKGRRPGFSNSSGSEEARIQFDGFCKAFRTSFQAVQTGIFQADMKVSLLNDGPVTILLDSDRNF